MPEGRPEAYDLSPMDELELNDLFTRQAELDEKMTMEDPDTHPKPPKASEEPVTDDDGNLVSFEPVAFEDGLLDVRL